MNLLSHETVEVINISAIRNDAGASVRIAVHVKRLAVEEVMRFEFPISEAKRFHVGAKFALRLAEIDGEEFRPDSELARMRASTE
jgi:hypothetical protein